MVKQKILVAGGAGFLGSHLCEQLLARGHSVVAVDNFITGYRANVAHLVGPNFELIELDAANAEQIVNHSFGLILHLASPASPPRYLAHPLETLHAGSIVTEALLKVALRDGARFVLASTSEIYGDPLVHPQVETYWGNVSSTGPRSVYDEAKRYAEAITFAYRRYLGVDTGVARPFNTYGPRMDARDGRAVPAFVSAALANQPLTLHGDGSQTRSLCFVDDQVDGLLRLAFSQEEGPINIGNPHEQSMLEVAQLIVELTGSSSDFLMQPRPVDDPERRRPDITKAAELLGFVPSVDIREGLTRTIAWYRSHLTFSQ